MKKVINFRMLRRMSFYFIRAISNTNVSVRYLLVSKSFYAFKCCAELENIKEARKNARNLLRTLYTKFICTHLS